MNRWVARAWGATECGRGCAAALAVGLGLYGCSPETGDGGAGEARAPAMEREYRAGAGDEPALTVVVRLDRTEATPADRLTLTIDARAGDGCSVEMPARADRLGDFRVAAVSGLNDPAPAAVVRPGGGRALVTYTLEPFLDGNKTIPAMTVLARRPGRRSPLATIITDPIVITVRSIIRGAGEAGAEGALSTATGAATSSPAPSHPAQALEPAKPPVAMAAARWPSAWVPVGIGVASVAAYLGAFAWASASRRRARTVIVDARRIALRELGEISRGGAGGESGAPERCALVAASLRRFVERRYAVPARSWSAGDVRAGPWSADRPIGERARRELAEILDGLDVVRFKPGGPATRSAGGGPGVDALGSRAIAWVERAAIDPAPVSPGHVADAQGAGA